MLGIRLDSGDAVVSMEMLNRGASILTVSEKGYGKRTEMEEYRLQSRGGRGIITMKATEKTGRIVGGQQVTDDDQLMLVTNNGKIIRLRMRDIRVIGRNTQGVRLIDVEEGERVAAAADTARVQVLRTMLGIRASPEQLYTFLYALPKGGDLHNHLSGSVYAESYIDYAAADGVCVDRKTFTLVPPPCDAAQGRPPGGTWLRCRAASTAGTSSARCSTTTRP